MQHDRYIVQVQVSGIYPGVSMAASKDKWYDGCAAPIGLIVVVAIVVVLIVTQNR